jgi:5-methyltetrahydropteroyltriglutamate--homocysteine methyltransferase
MTCANSKMTTMPERTSPPFRADQEGSMVRPPRLLDARTAFDRGELAIEALRNIEDEEIRKAVALQEGLGFRVVTDGEFRRESWNRDFLLKFSNVVLGQSRIALAYNTAGGGKAERAPTALAITGKISRPQPIFVDHFKFLKSIAHVTPKLTIPSPTILHFRGGRESIDAKAYPDIEGFYADVARVYQEEIADLAAAGCTYLQIDDVNFAYICDPRVAAQVRAMGEDPARLPHTYAKLINAVIGKRPRTGPSPASREGMGGGMTVGLHVCRGNAPSGWTEGSYEAVADILFNEIEVDGYFLEYDSPRAGGFEPLRFLPKGKIAVLGLVSTKTTQLEDKDALKRRIEEAARFAPLDQLAISTQCGFSSGMKSAGTRGMTEADEAAKLRLVVETAREVWG